MFLKLVDNPGGGNSPEPGSRGPTGLNSTASFINPADLIIFMG